MKSGASPVIVDVHLWELDRPAAEVARLRGLLSAEEQARADRFVRPVDRDRWTVSRAGLRLLLARKLDVAPAEIVFGVEANGRPTVSGVDALSFNLSHSADVAALAVSVDARVGVDVEEIRPITPDEIAWALAPAERAELASARDADQLDRFFRFWTLKEAFMKGTGLGAGLPLHSFDVSLSGPGLVRLAGDPDAPNHWKFNEIQPKSWMRGAVTACVGASEMIARWHWADIA